MKIRTSKELDRLMKNYFQQEGEAIQPPSSHERWADLKARLETRDPSEQTEDHDNEIVANKADSFTAKSYRFFRQHKAWTTLAAACLLLAVVISSIPSSNPLKEYFAGMVMLSEQEEDIVFEVQSVGDEQDSMVTPEPGYPPEEQLRTAETPVDEKAPSLFQADTLPEDMDLEALEQYPLGNGFEDAQEEHYLEFSEYAVFIDSLRHFKATVPDELWHSPQLPESFVFSYGHIIHSETALLDVRQVFSSAEGQQQLTITQSLFPDQEAARKAYHVEDASTVPVQIGPYQGFLMQDHGFSTITWLQENSIVNLTWQLDGEKLFEIIESMDTY